MHCPIEQGQGNQRAHVLDRIAAGGQPVVGVIEGFGLGGGQGRDGHIRLAIPIEVSHAVFFAIGGIGDAVFGVTTPVGRVIDLAPFHIGTKHPG
ncbi:hypothetical protein D3C85_1555160 [compost metagenome]